MKQLKQLNDFTIEEFNRYKELIESNTDTFTVLELFGIEDAYLLPFDEFREYSEQVKQMELSKKGVNKYYKINGKTYYAQLDILKLNAGQFIDLQYYMGRFQIHEVLSVFLIPCYKKNVFGKYIPYKYNTGYDIFEVQKDLLKHMKISEASELSTFFLSSSTSLLKIINNSLILKMEKKLKKREKQKKDLK